jgi:hypothetical protein
VVHGMMTGDAIERPVLIRGQQVMRQPGQCEPSRNGTPGGTPHGTLAVTWLALLVAAAILVIGCLSTFLMLEHESCPKVGDIVVFQPRSQDAYISQISIPATLVSEPGSQVARCSLEPNIMAQKGGSLIVERRQDEPSLPYLVHWAGSATAGTTENCGHAADLLLSHRDLQRLANAGGGFGIGDKGVVSIVPTDQQPWMSLRSR